MKLYRNINFYSCIWFAFYGIISKINWTIISLYREGGSVATAHSLPQPLPSLKKASSCDVNSLCTRVRTMDQSQSSTQTTAPSSIHETLSSDVALLRRCYPASGAFSYLTLSGISDNYCLGVGEIWGVWGIWDVEGYKMVEDMACWAGCWMRTSKSWNN